MQAPRIRAFEYAATSTLRDYKDFLSGREIPAIAEINRRTSLFFEAGDHVGMEGFARDLAGSRSQFLTEIFGRNILIDPILYSLKPATLGLLCNFSRVPQIIFIPRGQSAEFNGIRVLGDASLTVYDNGDLENLSGRPMNVVINGENLPLYSRTEFYPGGKVRTAKLLQPSIVQEVACGFGDILRFGVDGTLQWLNDRHIKDYVNSGIVDKVGVDLNSYSYQDLFDTGRFSAALNSLTNAIAILAIEHDELLEAVKILNKREKDDNPNYEEVLYALTDTKLLIVHLKLVFELVDICIRGGLGYRSVRALKSDISSFIRSRGEESGVVDYSDCLKALIDDLKIKEYFSEFNYYNIGQHITNRFELLFLVYILKKETEKIVCAGKTSKNMPAWRAFKLASDYFDRILKIELEALLENERESVLTLNKIARNPNFVLYFFLFAIQHSSRNHDLRFLIRRCKDLSPSFARGVYQVVDVVLNLDLHEFEKDSWN